MKVTRLNTYWEAEQVIAVIEWLDQLRDALIHTYQQEIDQYHQQQWHERTERETENLDLFDDTIDF